MLSEESIEKFRILYKKHFKKDMSREEAYESASKLFRLVQIIYKPMTKEEYKMVKKRQKELGII